jgi:predicted nucleotidyltransferase component of viral defense system
MKEKKKNIAASVRQKLANYAKENDLDFNLLLYRFANERFLYRLSISEYKDQFLLKGATLFTIWFDAPHRPTRDIDLLGFGSNEIADIEEIFIELCRIETEDGLLMDAESVKGIEIKEGEEYQGVRISLLAFLGKARINLQVDVGFGDAVMPKAEMIKIPTVLALPAPELRAYQKETVIAEKFEALVKLGMLNSRMKDFWDLYILIGEFEFDQKLLQKAIKATFERRQTTLTDKLPIALTEEFINDKGKQTQWNAFLRKNKLKQISLELVIDSLKEFFQPIIDSFGKD